MTKITDTCPVWYMPSEKRAFARGYRDGAKGKLGNPGLYPVAYKNGHEAGVIDTAHERAA